jgi:hypothetical protein
MGKNESLVLELLAYNTKQSKEFVRLEEDRKRLVRAHPTKIIAFVCMDGRINFPLIAGLPFGVVSSFRSLGGIFDFGNSCFLETLKKSVRSSLLERRDCLLVATYHFSKGEKYRGCKAWNYNTEAAKLGAEKLCAELEKTFASVKDKVYPVVLGIETDEDRFVIPDGVSLAKFPCAMQKDIGFILAENRKHVQNLPKRTEKEMQHSENIIAVGLGFDWIHLYNRALIIGPWRDDMETEIVSASEIVLSNLKEGRTAEDIGAVLLCGAVSQNTTRAGLALAEKETKTLAERCQKTIASRVPEIIPYLQVFAGTTNPKTRKFSKIS